MPSFQNVIKRLTWYYLFGDKFISSELPEMTSLGNRSFTLMTKNDLETGVVTFGKDILAIPAEVKYSPVFSLFTIDSKKKKTKYYAKCAVREH